MVYSESDLAAPFVIDVTILRDYIKDRPTHICGLVDASPIIRAEAFEYVLRKNNMNLIGLQAVMPMITTYAKRTQTPGFSFWRHIEAVYLEVKTKQTLLAAKLYLPLCPQVRTIIVVAATTTKLDVWDLLIEINAQAIGEILYPFKHLQKFTIVAGQPEEVMDCVYRVFPRV